MPESLLENLPIASNGLYVFMKAEDTSKFAGSVKVNVSGGLDASHAVRLLSRPQFPTVNPVNVNSSGNQYEGAPELYSTEVALFVDKSVVNTVTNCFTGANMGTVTIWEVATAETGPIILTTRTLSNVFIESWRLEFNVNYELITSEGMVLVLMLKYPKIDEVRTQYDATMGATGNVGASLDSEKALFETTS